MLNLRTGEHDVAKILLRDLVHATLGFEGLAERLDKSSKSLRWMLSVRGNPTTPQGISAAMYASPLNRLWFVYSLLDIVS